MAVYFAAILGAFVLGSCTFYTGTPNATRSGDAGNTASNSNAGASASGGNSANGSSGNSTGADAGATANDSGSPPWNDATGTLVGKTVSVGGVLYLSAKPDEDMLIAGIAGFGVWSSKDGGQTWTGLGLSGKSDLIDNLATAIVYDPDHPAVFWEAGIYGGGVYQTHDDGETFKWLGGIKHIELVGIDFTDKSRKTMIAGPHEMASTFNVSSDAGDSWTELKDNLPANGGFSSYPLVIDSKTFLMGCTDLIARSTDGGNTWTKVSNTGGYKRPLVASDDSIYWGTDGDVAVMRSTDQGVTWTRIVAAGVLNTTTMLELPDHRLAALSAEYVLVSDDAGATWKTASEKLPYKPAGLVYSAQQKAFFIWMGSGEKIPAQSIMRYDWDYLTN